MTTTTLTIIGVTGPKRHGKDTVGNYLVKHHGFTRLGFADPLKEACITIFGLSDEQVYGNAEKEVVDPYWGHSPRELLQKVGTELFRQRLPELCDNIHDDIWIRSMDRRIKNLAAEGITKFVITDVRFENECEYVKKSGGSMWRVIRDITTSNTDQHSSELTIDALICDNFIDNNGTIGELNSKVEDLMMFMRLNM